MDMCAYILQSVHLSIRIEEQVIQRAAEVGTPLWTKEFGRSLTTSASLPSLPMEGAMLTIHFQFWSSEKRLCLHGFILMWNQKSPHSL